MNEEDLQLIEQQLGRPPSGLQEVMKRNHNGFPAVLRVATMVEHNPFPTLFWLSDVQLNKWIHDLESAGMIERVQRIIDESAEFIVVPLTVIPSSTMFPVPDVVNVKSAFVGATRLVIEISPSAPNSNPDPAAFTFRTCPAEPMDDRPVPPLAIGAMGSSAAM